MKGIGDKSMKCPCGKLLQMICTPEQLTGQFYIHTPEYETITRVTTGLKSLKLFLKLSHSWFTGGGLLVLLR